MQYQVCPNITCIPAANKEQRLVNMSHAFSLNLPRLRVIPIAQTKSLAIIGGGPTLNDTYKEIANYDVVMSCGSTHDHLTKLGVRSNYHLECDPELMQVKYYQTNKIGCTYLVASRCHSSMFQVLKHKKVILWHMWEEDLTIEPYRGELAIKGAISCVLCALSTALAMGFKDIHFFGFDSSFPDKDNHHAYPSEESAQMLTTRLGDPETGPQFLTTSTWIAQARTFHEMQGAWGHEFKATVHGDSMMAEMQRQMGR
jgi:hypothetical protein